MSVLKVGLLLDNARVDRYVYELALWAKARPDIEISHLILHPVRRGHRIGGLRLLGARIVLRIVAWLETWRLARSGRYADHYLTRDLTDIVDGVAEITPVVSPSDYAYRFGDGDVEKVKGLGLDLLVRWGPGSVCGAIVRASRLGVISIHHGDNRPGWSGPAGFWECYERQPRTGFVVERLNEQPDGADVLMRGYFGTRHYYALNQAHLYRKSLPHLETLLAKTAAAGALPPIEAAPAPRGENRTRAPNFLQCIVYACKLLTRLCGHALGRRVLPRERWGLSVLPARWDAAAWRQSTETAPPRGHFWADPFLVARHGRTFCFVEDLVFEQDKGHIIALEVSGTALIERGVALKEPFHLSFPFLFEHRGALFMCPEALASGQIRVYRCTGFPLQWELEKVLMDGVSAADTMLFEKGGKWWMLTSIDESGSDDYCSELYLFSSDSPLSSSWIPHPQNPLRIDSFGGRNAGLIVEGDRIYRMAQCQGFDRYGHSLLAYEIRHVSETRYVETPVARIDPTCGTGMLGTHHLTTDGTITVIDHLSRPFPFSRARRARSASASGQGGPLGKWFDPEAVRAAAPRRAGD